MQKYYADH